MKLKKRLKILKGVLKRTYADELIAGLIGFFFLDAFVIMMLEPGINTYGDALWYCYAVFSTAGFGDFVAVTTLGRVLSILLTVLTILIVALVTGVIVAFYNDVVSMQYKASKAEILEMLQHLEDLSPEELKELSDRIKKVM
ncbi:MAG: potassium channel family protein [Lachnospiraceae bacterium]|nr:potassium channel family protein [Lachnospiraceae bacterium]